MAIQSVHSGIYRNDDVVQSGELASLLAEHGTRVVVGHPTYGNVATIGQLVADDIAAARVYPERPTAIVISDGTGPPTDNAVLEAALNAAKEVLAAGPAPAIVVGLTYDGYKGDVTPGKGSALKLLFDESHAANVETLLLADGDLRNDMGQWRAVYEKLHATHTAEHGDRPYFVTARYARHVVDASLTRFIVGPLTTLLGTYVPGGISGDIALSHGALAHEVAADWTEARRKYGTDISTTLDNVASGTLVYEVSLGAKLHDVTDEARLTVMPGEVIGAALERLRFWEANGGLVSRTLDGDATLGETVRWGAEETGIGFIDPGATDVFDMDLKVNALVEKFGTYRPDLAKVLSPADLMELETRVALLGNARRGDEAPLPTLGMTMGRWIEVLQDGVAYAMTHDDFAPACRALNYLYTAAFQSFVRDKLVALGIESLGAMRGQQTALQVPPDQAEVFYRDAVDGVVDRLARQFFESRGRLAAKLSEAAPS